MSTFGIDNLSERWRSQLREGTSAVEDRVALARLEWTAQVKGLQSMLVLAVLLGGLTIVALVLLSMALIVHFWDTPHRQMVSWAVAGVWMLAWVTVLAMLLGVLRKSTHPFALTRAELSRDWSLFKEKL